MVSASSRGHILGWLAAMVIAWPSVVDGAAPPQGERREDLMDQLGLPKKTKPKPKPEDPPNEDDEDAAGDEGDDAGATPPETVEPTPAEPADPSVTYVGSIRRLLDRECKSCHGRGESAGNTKLVITGSVSADYKSAKRLVDLQRPQKSALLTKATGAEHGGGKVFARGSSRYAKLLAWIEAGAPRGGTSGGASPTPAPVPTPTEPVPAPKPKPRPQAKPQAATPPHEPAPSLESAPDTAISYARVHAILQAECASCHREGAFASHGAFALSGDPGADYPTISALVRTDDPGASRLLTKARGQNHGGGTSLKTDAEDYATLLAWIEAGALGPEGAAPAPAPAPDAVSGASTHATPEPAPDAVSGASPHAEGASSEGEAVDATTGATPRADEPGALLGDGTPLPEAHGSGLPFQLPLHLRLNGRFDLAYERRDYKDHPFGPGRNLLQTYHHFLFLSRSGAKDPFGFNVELITLQFFEFNARFATPDKRATFLLKAGKLLVPFGDEPLFHRSYGGKAGFDQPLLPPIWAQPGLDFNTKVVAGPVGITNDLYAVQGYALRSADAVLNLQGDFSTLDEFQFAAGDRVGASIGPVAGWYSFQLNPLGYGRLLFMQAVDLMFMRPRGIPFLEDISAGLGGVRADVSGGGVGQDYYHFASYAKIRYYPLDWLYIQYRAGLKTFDNRRGLYFDDTRIDERDASSHNVTIGAMYKGFYAMLQLFWNLEKANEQDDDFLRFSVGYAF